MHIKWKENEFQRINEWSNRTIWPLWRHMKHVIETMQISKTLRCSGKVLFWWKYRGGGVCTLYGIFETTVRKHRGRQATSLPWSQKTLQLRNTKIWAMHASKMNNAILLEFLFSVSWSGLCWSWLARPSGTFRGGCDVSFGGEGSVRFFSVFDVAVICAIRGFFPAGFVPVALFPASGRLFEPWE